MHANSRWVRLVDKRQGKIKHSKEKTRLVAQEKAILMEIKRGRQGERVQV